MYLKIGEIRVKNGIKWKKVSEGKWIIASKSEEKKPDQEVQTFLSNQIVSWVYSWVKRNYVDIQNW